MTAAEDAADQPHEQLSKQMNNLSVNNSSSNRDDDHNNNQHDGQNHDDQAQHNGDNHQQQQQSRPPRRGRRGGRGRRGAGRGGRRGGARGGGARGGGGRDGGARDGGARDGGGRGGGGRGGRGGRGGGSRARGGRDNGNHGHNDTRRGGQRGGNSSRSRREPLESLPPHLRQLSSRILKVSAGSLPKKVAGAVAQITREGECPIMLASGVTAVNQLVKSVAIGRRYLDKDNIELSVTAEFSNPRRRDTGGFTFRLLKTPKSHAGPASPGGDNEEIKVSSQSMPAKVAGAISQRVREGTRLWISAIGPDAVWVAIKAITTARTYLEENSVDLSFRPEFVNVEFPDGRQSSSIRLMVLVSQV